MDDAQFNELIYVLTSIRDELRDLSQVIAEGNMHKAHTNEYLQCICNELYNLRVQGITLDVSAIESVFAEFEKLLQDYGELSERLHETVMQYLSAIRPPPPSPRRR